MEIAVVAVPALVLILAASFSSYFFLAAPIPDRLPAGAESGQTSRNDTAAELEIARLRAEARRNALATGAGFVAIAALILALRRQQHLEQATKNTETDALRRQQHLERSSANAEDDALQRRITDARVRAVDQLGSDNPAVRIGGLHNLERIGQQHEEFRQLVLDEICSYLRLPFTSLVPKTKDQLPAGQFEPIGPPPKEVQMDEAEGEVRLIAQEILQRHLNPNDDCSSGNTLA
jgi:signal transduction histidine kinase